MAKRKRRNFTPEFKAEVVLESLRGEVHKQNCVGVITSATNNSQSGNVNSLKMRCLSLNRLISSPMPLWSGLRNLSNSLGG